ncbi:MAG TPA: hypothetical protein VN368_00960 [Candidatus Methylomirabilis sp.]|nr:hypothetical protein [Candidatus Methylomirabilis sp.]
MSCIIATPDSATASRIRSIDENIRSLKDNFISPEYNAPGIVWRVVNGKKVGFRQYGIWTEKRSINYQVLYEHTETFAGSTTTLNLDFFVNVNIQRIELIYNDSTAKDYEIRIYSDYNSDSYYNLLDKGTSNQDTPLMNYDPMSGMMPAGSRLQLYFSNYTAGKIVKIVVGAEEI